MSERHGLRSETKSGGRGQSRFYKPTAVNAIHGLESLQEKEWPPMAALDKPVDSAATAICYPQLLAAF
jgi:hypothetical protein